MAQCYCMHLKDPKLLRFNVEFNFLTNQKVVEFIPLQDTLVQQQQLMVFYWQYQMF